MTQLHSKNGLFDTYLLKKKKNQNWNDLKRIHHDILNQKYLTHFLY